MRETALNTIALMLSVYVAVLVWAVQYKPRQSCGDKYVQCPLQKNDDY